jgi:8-oxo-dGTP diphosphatase
MNQPNFDDLPYSAAVAVDVVIFTIQHNTLKVLLVKRPNKPYQGIFALPGGFLQKHETTEDATQRIMKDKAGIADVFVE